ncbi:SOS response-associated peptidase [Silvibacterium acidisoli]|uniref:SOS response-associated peptidase n=1 Tax=Acidobacteriaceae bacterium ZG23-2 TaxID=2883246 RepID=UPI00406D4C62
MCGRYYRRSDKQRIAEAFQVRDLDVFDLELSPSYNIAPATRQPVIRLNDQGYRELAVMRWGLVPYWSKDSKPSYATINARAETVATSPLYKEPFRRRRCLIPADGFFEWKKLDAKNKQPFAFGPIRGGGWAFAGIWDRWIDKATSRALETYSIVTTEPNEISVDVHDRMPVIVSPKDYQRWMEPGDPQQPPTDLLRPFPADEMKLWPVSRDVGNVNNNRPELIMPVQ